MKKAKSRLQKQSAILDKVQPAETIVVSETKRKNQPNGRLKHWKTLAIGLIFLIGLTLLILFVDPELVKNWLIPNGYLPFLFLLFGFIFFVTSFVCLNSLLGLWVALLVCLFVFLKIQQVIFSGVVIGFFGLGLLPIGALVVKKKLLKN